MELLKDVLIKEVNGKSTGDLVVYIDNLPKNLLYQRVKKMIVDPYDPQQRVVPEYTLSESGKKIPTNVFCDELLPGIEKSATGDNAYVFFMAYNEAAQRLKDIDRYVKMNVPVAERVQERVFYSLQPGVMTSGTIPLANIPRITLPALVSPPAQAVQERGVVTGSLEKPKRKPMTDEQKQAARERMARAREVRTAQQTGQLPK
jgi:hypothetical protein